MNPFEKYLDKIEAFLKTCVPVCDGVLSDAPSMLAYSLDGGGKRVRPVLSLAFCEAAGGNPDNALFGAAAVEFVHTYSLIHDDLPAMDNDDMRRGKPSSHIRFGEANAILTGDALLTHAFYLLSQGVQKGALTPLQGIKSVEALSHFAGINGMVGGQYIDLAYENRRAGIDVLFTMDALKTSALMKASVVLGLLAAEAEEEKIKAAEDFALYLGLAFQITDDLLEFSEDGVSADEKNNKSTYITELGFEKAKALAAGYTEKAVNALKPFGASADCIRQTAIGLLSRKK